MIIEFTTNDPLAMAFPPVPAKKMIPEWYKEIPAYNIDENLLNDAQFLVENDIVTGKTVKACMPVQDYLTSGYILRNHSQILITPKIEAKQAIHITDETDIVKNFWWKAASEAGDLGYHGYRQCPVKIGGVKNNYFKFSNPWKIRVPKGYSCLFYQPQFFFEERFQLFPGIVDCDEFDGAVLFPGIIKTRESFYVNPGDPLMLVFPFKRDDWNMETKLVSDEEWKKKKSRIFSYMYEGYKTLFHKRKNYK